MASDTFAALGSNAEECMSRSLLLDRLVFRNADMDEARKLQFAQICTDSFETIQRVRSVWQREIAELRNWEAWEHDGQRRRRLAEDRQRLEGFVADTDGMARRKRFVAPTAAREACAAYRSFVGSVPDAVELHAQLVSRLLVNMAGGVMENAGVCLDRFGLPYIPGSAVKGCARRAALAALHEWCETGQKPGGAEAGNENVFKPACERFGTQADMLAAIARVFGWTEVEWSTQQKEDRFISDFAWACDSEALRKTWKSAAEHLAASWAWNIQDKHRDAPWKSLPNFGGSVSFLPAYPVHLNDGPEDKAILRRGLPAVPPTGKFELDVVTVHHKRYYEEPAEPKDVPESHQRWQRWKQEHDQWEAELGTAPDTEEPVPNVFPAVAPGHIFSFALVPLRRGVGQVLGLPVAAPSGGRPQDTAVAQPTTGTRSRAGRPGLCPTSLARTWLKVGLETFGLGSKTNAGYGWFHVVRPNEDGSLGSAAPPSRGANPLPLSAPAPPKVAR